MFWKNVLTGVLFCLTVLFLSFPLSGETARRTLYVNNLSGNDSFNGLSSFPSGDGKTGPFATIGKAFASVNTSDKIEIENTGTPYIGGNTLVKAGGTPEEPLVIDGYGATISGLAVVPPEKWDTVSADVISTEFYPMSNMLKGYREHNYWIGSPQIWWLDGKAAPNCKSMEELEKTENGFFWDKWKKKVFVHLPAGKKKEDVKIEIPVYGTSICINTDFVVVKNLRSMLSWNDGFDTHGAGKNIVFKNCIATGNCGQGFSVHETTSVLYEDCVADGCASSGSCDVNLCSAIYRRCIFVNNTFEAGVYTNEYTQHVYESCLIIGNGPFEQVWQIQNSAMTFNNCVIIGKSGNPSGILKMQNGTVDFLQSTILDASFMTQITKNFTGTLKITNCIVGRTQKPFLSIPVGMVKSRLDMDYNVYFDSPGIDYEGNIYNEKNWDEYVKKSGLDKNSKWFDPGLEGPFKSSLPKNSELLKAGILYSAKIRIGASLPESVWELYYKTRGDYPTPSGVIKKK